jgi:hypothetical protein
MNLPPSLHIQEMAVLLWQDIDIEISLLRLYQTKMEVEQMILGDY